MGDLHQTMEELNLQEDEEEAIFIDQQGTEKGMSLQYCFIGFYLTYSMINYPAMRSMMANVWHPIGGISITKLGEGRLLFRLYNEVDADIIESEGPWCFNSHILVFHMLQEQDDPMKIPLHFVDFWIQINKLPVGYISEQIAKQIENFIGKFLAYDATTVTLGYRGSIRACIRLDVRLPEKKLALANGKFTYTTFQYEKLKLFCYLCGKLGHREGFCPLRLTHKDLLPVRDASLKAPPVKGRSMLALG
ncbi:uncharacterized protein LOC120198147 [Hibiscus syriacus]|uniref:uncharacterized protein LOC120198147 n=1 Tax=Hibiscus syriacus TaxID=106335 RepID=UPI001921EA12|nr:uncharacterized protein LOC120198147 [Hibiscus syriacus]